MSTSKVDSKKRIVLPQGVPGDIYEIQHQPDGHLLLVRLHKPTPAKKLSRNACMEAMQNAPLSPTMSWEQLQKLTRAE